MNQRELIKKLLIAAGVILLLIIFFLCIRPNRAEKDDHQMYISSMDIEGMNQAVKRDEINYDNPTEKEKEYLKKAYGDTVAFTTDGTVVYHQKAFSGPIKKYITSSWPEQEITSLIPKPEFGTLERVEYLDTFVRVYLLDVKAGDVSHYNKELKNKGYKESSKKIETDALLEYSFKNEEEIKVKVSYYKKAKRCEIYLVK